MDDRTGPIDEGRGFSVGSAGSWPVDEPTPDQGWQPDPYPPPTGAHRRPEPRHDPRGVQARAARIEATAVEAPRRRAGAAEPEPWPPEDETTSEQGPAGEPVVIAHAVTVILCSIVTATWVVVPDPVVDAIVTLVTFVVATVGAVLARARVSPLKGGLTPAIAAYVEDQVEAEVARRMGSA